MAKGNTYLHADHLGSVSVTSSDTGALVSQQTFDPWGKVRGGGGGGTITQTTNNYTGQKLDGTGLLFYNARYYDPGLGRFVSADTIVPSPNDPQSTNRYSYTHNNPISRIDASGHCDGTPDKRGNDKDCWDAYDAVIGGAYGKLGYVPDLSRASRDVLVGLLKWINRGARFESGKNLSGGRYDWTAQTLTTAVSGLNAIERAFSYKFTGPVALEYAINKALFNGNNLTLIANEGDNNQKLDGLYDPRGINITINFFFNSFNVGSLNLVIHELGHAVDFNLGGRKGYWSKGATWNTARDTVGEAGAPSEYPYETCASVNCDAPVEDFAETFTSWVNYSNLGFYYASHRHDSKNLSNEPDAYRLNAVWNALNILKPPNGRQPLQ